MTVPSSVTFPKNTGTTFNVTVSDLDWFRNSVEGEWHYYLTGNTYGTLWVPETPYTDVTLGILSSSGNATSRTVTYSITAGNVTGGTFFDVDVSWVDAADDPVNDGTVTKTFTVNITN
ncbi:MAG: hypothetical protein WCG75_09905 [Armatimonadota bacterium]